MKKAVIALAAVLILCGCATFGTFANLEKGKSTKHDVTSMLGRPVSKHYEADREVWEYRFVEQGGKEGGGGWTVMRLAITFKEHVVSNYKVTVSKESIGEPPMRGPMPRPRGPIRPPR